MEKTRRQHCWNCGEDMGEWSRCCDKRDTCGRQECEQAARDAYRAEVEQAHADIDEFYGQGW